MVLDGKFQLDPMKQRKYQTFEAYYLSGVLMIETPQDIKKDLVNYKVYAEYISLDVMEDFGWQFVCIAKQQSAGNYYYATFKRMWEVKLV